MEWLQNTDPLNNMLLSTLTAMLPIFFIFWALIIRKMKGYLACLLMSGISLLIAITVYKMPMKLAVLSAGHGILYGLFPICWIIVPGLFLFNLTVASGQFELIKRIIGGITTDRRLQVLLISFSFGSFLEGTAGFAIPVIITSAMLFSLGFEPLYASGICLIANTAPVAFGSIGIPVIVASHVSGIPELAISQMVGRTLPFISLVLPFYLIVVMSGYKKTVEILPACLVSGLTFAFFQWYCSNYMGPMLPDIIAGIASIVSLVILFKFWKPKNIFHFGNDNLNLGKNLVYDSPGNMLKAFSPFIILTMLVIGWGIQPVKEFLNSIGGTDFPIPGLHNQILLAGGKNKLVQVFHLNYLSAAGTAIFLSAIISVPVIGSSYKNAMDVFNKTLFQLKYPVMTICAVLSFTYVSNNSGMSYTTAKALAATGLLFPFFSPILGWLGVFMTGSDTSSNAMFATQQGSTAAAIGIDPVITVSANCSGGVIGKMISPQSISVSAAAGGLTGKESSLFRFTVKHSFFLLMIVCILVCLQAYVFKWVVPHYEMVNTTYNQFVLQNSQSARRYLLILTFFVIAFIAVVRILSNKRNRISDI
jgi:lactate permease